MERSSSSADRSTHRPVWQSNFAALFESWPPRHRRDVSSTEHSTHWLIFTQANNMLMVYLIQQGVAVEDMLQAVGPFASTVYAKKE